MELKARKLGKLAIAVFAAIIAFTAADNIAGAAPTATIEMSTRTPHAGTPIIFDGSHSICDSLQGCSYTWQWFWRSPDGTTTHLGGQMGRTPIVTYEFFDAFAATKPYVIVTLTVGAGRVRRPSTAWVAFVVLPAIPDDQEEEILAVDDQAFASYDTGGTPIANVLANDTLGGLTADLSVVSLRQVSTDTPGLSLDPASGAVIVAAGTSSGTYTLIYEVCEIANPSNCKQATVTLLAETIDAVDDVFPELPSEDGGVSPSVLINDRFNDEAATLANVQLSLLTELPDGITFDFTTGAFTVAPQTESGDYPVTYQICEIGSLTHCDSASLVLKLSSRNN